MKPLQPAATLLIAFCLYGCSESEGEREERSVGVVAQTVEILPDEEVVEAVGTARAARSAQLFPEVAGRVTAVRFSPGAFVRAGQPLISLDARAERLALQLAEVRVQEAEQLLSRYRRIEDTGALSASQIEAGETALAAAQVERDQASVALSDRVLRAPFSGHVSFTEIDVGDRITPTTEVAQIDQRSRLFVDFNAPEAVFARLNVGQVVEVMPFSDPGTVIEARIEAVDSNIGLEQRSYTVRTVIDNSEDRYRPGMSFRVNFEDRGQPRPAVPEAAVVWGGEGSSIFIVEDKKAKRIPVTITSRREGTVLLDADIPDGALVIIEGVQKVREGQAVELVQPAERSPTKVEVAGSQ